MPIEFDASSPAVLRVLITAAIVVAALILSRLGRRLADRYIDEAERKYRVAKFASRAIAILSLLLIVALWSSRLSALLTILTIIGAGAAVALRDVLLSFAGWINIALSTPYKQGDRIEVNGVRGDVVDIRVLHTVLMEIGNWVHADQSTGRLVRIPNSWIFLHDIENYTRGFGFIWNEFDVTITFRSDWQDARAILLELAETTVDSVAQKAERQLRHLAREHLIHYTVLTPFVYLDITENGVQLTLRHLCPARGRRNIRHKIVTTMLERFRAHGQIELAYPMIGAQVLDTPQFGKRGPSFDSTGDTDMPPSE